MKNQIQPASEAKHSTSTRTSAHETRKNRPDLAIFVLMFIASLVCSNVYSQELTINQKEKIASEIAADFDKNIKAAESFDAKGLADYVNDTLKAGFMNNGIFLNSFDEVMKGYQEEIRGIRSLKYSISNKRITVLADNAALLTVSGKASIALDDGRSFTGGFAWTFVYSKINGNWKIIHTHMSTPR